MGEYERKHQGMSAAEFSGTQFYVGPTPERQLEEHKKLLEQQMERVVARVNYERQVKEEFDNKYGPDLADYAASYMDRGQNGFIHLRGQSVSRDEVRPLFARELTRAISAQPEEQREQWLETFLKEVEKAPNIFNPERSPFNKKS